MTDMTMGIIYSVKQGLKSPCENVIDFMSKYTNCDPKVFGDAKMKSILVDAFIDYLRTADDPGHEVWCFFDAKGTRDNYRLAYPEVVTLMCEKLHFLDDDSEAIMDVFKSVRVLQDGKYINGFKEMEV